jgi:hypothetical protein
MQNGRTVSQNRVFTVPYGELKWSKPQIKVERRGDRAVFSSPTFVWAACLDIDGEAALSDDAFDLLPGVDYEIDWPAEKPLPQIQRCASTLPW